MENTTSSLLDCGGIAKESKPVYIIKVVLLGHVRVLTSEGWNLSTRMNSVVDSLDRLNIKEYTINITKQDEA